MENERSYTLAHMFVYLPISNIHILLLGYWFVHLVGFFWYVYNDIEWMWCALCTNTNDCFHGPFVHYVFSFFIKIYRLTVQLGIWWSDQIANELEMFKLNKLYLIQFKQVILIIKHDDGIRRNIALHERWFIYLHVTDPISASLRTAHPSVIHLWFAPFPDAERWGKSLYLFVLPV